MAEESWTQQRELEDMTGGYTHGMHFLRDWQRSLSCLPIGTAVFVVSGCGDRPKEPEAVLLDRGAASLWMCSRPDPLDYKVEGFTVTRQHDGGVTLLRPGAPANNPLAVIERTIYPKLAPLPSDREFIAAQPQESEKQ
jgi:hypothetical protein